MQNGNTFVLPLRYFGFAVWRLQVRWAYMPQPQPQLGAASQQEGAGAQLCLAAQRAFSRANKPGFLQQRGASSQQGVAASQPQLGAASQQVGAGAGAQQGAGAGAGAGAQQGAGAPHPQLGAASQQLVAQPQPAAR